MNKFLLRGSTPLALTLFASAALAQAPMTIGNLAVLRIGDGSVPLTDAAQPSFIEEWNPAGPFVTPVQTIAVPTAAVGAQFACTNNGSSTSEGQLNLSANGRYLVWGGYDATPGTLAVSKTMNPPTARVCARLDVLLGALDTSTALTDAFGSTAGTDNANIRGVASYDGEQFWATSPIFGTDGGGVRYLANLGATTSTLIAAGNIRHVGVFHGDLYVTQNSGGVRGVAQVGSGGLPTGAEAINLLNGFPTLSGPSPYDFFWADPNTVYVADDNTGGGGGIQKWTQTAGTWSLQYVLGLGIGWGARGVTGIVQNGVTTLYGIAVQGFPSTVTEIITVTDTGAGSAVTSLGAAPADTVYRGIRLLRKPSNTSIAPFSCGPAELVATGNGDVGTDVFFKMRNTQGLAQLIAIDGTFTGLPLNLVFANCACTLGVSPAPILLPNGAAFTLNLNPSWATVGLAIHAQGLDLFTPAGGPCPDLLDLTLTDTASFTVQ